MCSGAIKKQQKKMLSPSASFVGKSEGTDVSARTGVCGEHTFRKIDERSPADDGTRQAKSMRNRTAAQRLACYACWAPKHLVVDADKTGPEHR